LAYLLRCWSGHLFCLVCFVKWQNWKLAAVTVIVLRMADGWSVVYKFVKRIPKGRVVTYGQVARATRLPGGARAAGRAMAACPRGHAIPWHRVVAAGGRIAVREPFAGLQRRLLESEGVRLVNGRVALASHLWQPKGVLKLNRRLATSRPARRRRRPRVPQ